jgi:hypothetical protein
VNRVVAGIAAGAVGTSALNVSTYLDMAVRGRPESELPAKAAESAASAVGVDLSAGAEDGRAEDVARNRKGGIGALMGYATGLGFGALYGLVRPRVRGPLPLVGVLLGLGVMAGSDVPSIASGMTDPREWGLAGWLSDVVPISPTGWPPRGPSTP